MWNATSDQVGGDLSRGGLDTAVDARAILRDVYCTVGVACKAPPTTESSSAAPGFEKKLGVDMILRLPTPGKAAADQGAGIHDLGRGAQDPTHAVASASVSLGSGMAEQATGCGSPLLLCPWYDALAYFVALPEIRQLCCAAASLRAELTVEAVDGQRLLVLPAVDVAGEDPEGILKRISVPHVKTFRLWKRRAFDAVEALVAARGPKEFKSIERLAFKGCPLDIDDFRLSLTPVFVHVGGLQHLNFEKNQVTDSMIDGMVKSGALAAARPLSMNLRLNCIGPAGAAALASCSDGLCRMKWLNLKQNRIGDEGASALAAMLKQNTTMNMLNLRWQMPALTDATALAFAEALECNATLERLRLRRNRISDTGAVALAGAIKQRLANMRDADPHSRPRVELDLEGNRVGLSGALALFDAVSDAPSARDGIELLLCGNPVDHARFRQAVAEDRNNSPRVSFQTKPEALA